MSRITLYHGSPHKIVKPMLGGGNDKQDYGNGFYLTPVIDLAKEWAVCRPDTCAGYVHTFILNTDTLKILDFQSYGVIGWLCELMKHRDASDGRRYQMLKERFIDKYGIDTSGYDCIKGWRANASYFYIAREFAKDNIDVDILEELLSLGDFGIQYCIKTKAAYDNLIEIEDEL